MTHHNELYYYINQAKSHLEDWLASQIEIKTNLFDSHYAFIDLPVAEQTVLKTQLGGFSLDEHHLSIHEKYSDHKDIKNSLYHYTGYFTDASNERHQLHVHFNRHHQVVYTAFSTGHFSAELGTLVEFAEATTHVTMAVIEKCKQTNLKKLHDIYLQMEKNLLEAESNKDREKYAKQLPKIIHLLIQTIKISNAEEHRALLKNFQLRLKAIANNNQSPITDDVDNTDTDEVTNEINDLSLKDGGKNDSIKKDDTSSHNKFDFDDLIAKAENAKNEYFLLSNDKAIQIERKVAQMLKFDESIADIQVALASENKKEIELQYSGKLNELKTTKDIEAKKLLCSLFIHAPYSLELAKEFKNDLSLAKELKKFIPLAPNLLKMAFANNNGELLNYLLTEGESFKTSDSLKIDGVDAVLACYLAQAEGKNKDKFFGMLIKHGTNLSVKAPDGLSVAYHILSAPQHALFLSLFKHTAKSQIEALIRSVKHEVESYIHANKGKLSNDVLAEIKGRLRAFEDLPLIFELIKTDNQTDAYFDKLNDFISEEQSQFLIDDESLRGKHGLYLAAQLRWCKAKEIKKPDENVKMSIEEFKEIRKKIPENLLKKITINQLKDLMLMFMDNETKNLNLEAQILETEKLIKNAKSKAVKKPLIKHLNELHHQISQHAYQQQQRLNSVCLVNSHALSQPDNSLAHVFHEAMNNEAMQKTMVNNLFSKFAAMKNGEISREEFGNISVLSLFAPQDQTKGNSVKQISNEENNHSSAFSLKK